MTHFGYFYESFGMRQEQWNVFLKDFSQKRLNNMYIKHVAFNFPMEMLWKIDIIRWKKLTYSADFLLWKVTFKMRNWHFFILISKRKKTFGETQHDFNLRKKESKPICKIHFSVGVPSWWSILTSLNILIYHFIWLLTVRPMVNYISINFRLQFDFDWSHPLRKCT